MRLAAALIAAGLAMAGLANPSEAKQRPGPTPRSTPAAAPEPEEPAELRRIQGTTISDMPGWVARRIPNSTQREMIELFREMCPRIAQAGTVAEQQQAQRELVERVREFGASHPFHGWIGQVMLWLPPSGGRQGIFAISLANGLWARTASLGEPDPARTRIPRGSPVYTAASSAPEYSWVRASVELVGATEDDSCGPVVRFRSIDREEPPLGRR